MKKTIFTTIIFAFILFLKAQAQISTISQPNFSHQFDSIRATHTMRCGLNETVIKRHTYPYHSNIDSIAAAQRLAPSSFPANAIKHCGKFDIYYADIAANISGGFNDHTNTGGTALGIRRQNTMCDVLSYIQSVFDFSNIPSSAPIRLYIDTSYITGLHPVPIGSGFAAFASPNIQLPVLSGIVSGDVHDYVVSGTNPTPANTYHAFITVNFDVFYAQSGLGWTTYNVDYQNDTTANQSKKCIYDLYTILLHEVGHTLGWMSFMQATGNQNTTPYIQTIFPTVFAGLDTSMRWGNPNPTTTSFKRLVVNTNGTYVVNNTIGFNSGTTIYQGDSVWINRFKSPANHSVFAGMLNDYGTTTPTGINASWFSHLNDQRNSYNFRERVSPGERQEYVMAPNVIQGVERRLYTEGEVRTLLSLGYNFNTTTGSYGNAHSWIPTNLPPFSQKMANYVFTQKINTTNFYYSSFFPELVQADHTITNNVGSSYTYNVSTDASITDKNGDAITIMPTSIINIRGCGNGANNHNQLTLSANGQSITYTPKANFYGRAQFAFNVWDGKEKGSYILYTIDVKKGTNVSCAVGSNIVLNGDFENGTEIKRAGIDEQKPYTVEEEYTVHEGKITTIGQMAGLGIVSSDSHPYDWWLNGSLVDSSFIACYNATTFKTSANSPYTSFPSPPSSINCQYPTATTSAIGHRYGNIAGYYNYFYLCTAMQKCHYFKFSFDYNSYACSSVGHVDTLTVAFTSNTNASFLYPQPPPFLYSVQKPLPYTNHAWVHDSIQFAYCSDSLTSIMDLSDWIFHSVNSFPNIKQIFIDNISLAETTPPVLKATIFSTGHDSIYCNGAVAKTLKVKALNPMCTPTYVWQPSGSTADSILVSPTTKSTYIVTVFDGCNRVASDTFVVIPKASPTISINPIDTSICKGKTASIIAKGANTYAWSPAATLNQATGATVTATPAATTTYMVVGTDTATGCTDTATAILRIRYLPTIKDTLTPHVVCSGTTIHLTALGNAVQYHWSVSPAYLSISNDTAIHTTSIGIDTLHQSITAIYTLLGIDSFGCKATDTAQLKINPVPRLTILDCPRYYCSNEFPPANPISITTKMPWATNGNYNFSWQSTVMGTFSPVSPIITADTQSTVIYTPPTNDSSAVISVILIDGNGCRTEAGCVITVYPSPDSVLIFVPSHSVCWGDSIKLNALVFPFSNHGKYSWSVNSNGYPAIAAPKKSAALYVRPLVTTTYYVQFMDTITGCKVSNAVTITVLSLPTIIATAAPKKICVSGTTILQASGGNTYLWTSNPSGLNSTATSVNQSISATTTYFLVGTNTSNGCKNKDSIKVKISTDTFKVSIYSKITTNIDFCSHNNVLVAHVSPWDTGLKYTWTPCTSSSTTLCHDSVFVIPANATTGTVYTCVVTKSSGCSTTATYTVGSSPLAFFIPSGISSTSSLGVTAWSNTDIYFSSAARLILNTNFTIKHCRLHFASNSLIDVGNTRTLLIDSSLLTIGSCHIVDSMWEGLHVQNGGMITMHKDTVLHAKSGITSINGGNYMVDNCLFKANYYHISVNAYSVAHNGIIKNTVFDGTPLVGNTLIRPYLTTSRTPIAIQVTDVKNIVFGNYTTFNTFKNCGVGINYINTVNKPYTTSVFHNHFVDCATGVRAVTYGGNVMDNTFANSTYNSAGSINLMNGNLGVLVYFLRNQNINVTNNHFNNLNYGIVSAFNNAASIMMDNNNIVSGLTNTGLNLSSVGIYLYEQSYVVSNSYAITNNLINDCNVGIYSKNINGYAVNGDGQTWYQNQLYNNKIHFNMLNSVNALTSTKYGIWFENTKNVFAQCNTIDNFVGMINTNRAIPMQSSLGNFIEGNYIQNFTNGIFALGANSPTYLLANTFDNNAFGVVLVNGGKIGNQGNFSPPTPIYANHSHWGNMWTNVATAAQCTYSINGSNGAPSDKIFVRANSIPAGNTEVIPYYNSTFNTGSTSSIPLGFSTTLTYTSSASNTNYPYSSSCGNNANQAAKTTVEISEEMLRTAQDSTFATPEEGMNDFFSQLALYENLMQDRTVRDEEGVLEHFIDMVNYDAIGKFYNAEQEIALAHDSSLLLNEDSTKNTIRLQHLQNALNYVSDINTTLQSVQYYQQINQLYLHFLINDSLDESEKENVSAIAALCPLIYGTAVDNARGLASALGFAIDWNDNDICYGNFRTANNNANYDSILAAVNKENENKISSSISSNPFFNLYPNPVNRTLNAKFENISENCSFIIYNGLGQRLITRIIKKNIGVESFDVSQYPNGVYLIKALNSDGITIAQLKFIIEK
ncbi:MAG: hypothetical protein RJA07_2799 [Bacteroidota bacterium]|jgi:hypothetical protein